jgi:hypothetical protein
VTVAELVARAVAVGAGQKDGAPPHTVELRFASAEDATAFAAWAATALHGPAAAGPPPQPGRPRRGQGGLL